MNNKTELVKRKKTASESLAVRLKTGLIAEKGLAYSLLWSADNEDYMPDWDYKVWWIGDVIAKAIYDEYGLNYLTEEDKKPFQLGRNDLEKMEKYLTDLEVKFPDAYEKEAPSIWFKCDDVREGTNRSSKQLSNRQIFHLVKRFASASLVRIKKRIIHENKNDFMEEGEFASVCKIKFIRTGKLSNRNKIPEYYFKPIFDTAATLDFWNSIRLGLFDHRPPSFYHMRGQTQLIVRAYGWTKTPSKTTLKRLVKITGMDKTKKNKTDQMKMIKSYLNEAKDAGYIANWTAKKETKGQGGHVSVLYEIFKISRWPVR